VHISTWQSLAIHGGIIALSLLISVIRAEYQAKAAQLPQKEALVKVVPRLTPEHIAHLADADPSKRAQVALDFLLAGTGRVRESLQDWEMDDEFRALLVREKVAGPIPRKLSPPKLTVGIAVLPETFEKIRAANGSPPLADAPADQDVMEFELEFATGALSVRLDVLTTRRPAGNGAIARFLEKFGEGIQQIEIDVMDVDRATEILRSRFKVEPVYPAIRAGANGTRVNFFLVTAHNNQKVLVELVEQPKRT
jgi:hypothetical protein